MLIAEHDLGEVGQAPLVVRDVVQVDGDGVPPWQRLVVPAHRAERAAGHGDGGIIQRQARIFRVLAHRRRERAALVGVQGFAHGRGQAALVDGFADGDALDHRAERPARVGLGGVGLEQGHPERLGAIEMHAQVAQPAQPRRIGTVTQGEREVDQRLAVLGEVMEHEVDAHVGVHGEGLGLAKQRAGLRTNPREQVGHPAVLKDDQAETATLQGRDQLGLKARLQRRSVALEVDVDDVGADAQRAQLAGRPGERHVGEVVGARLRVQVDERDREVGAGTDGRGRRAERDGRAHHGRVYRFARLGRSRDCTP